MSDTAGTRHAGGELSPAFALREEAGREARRRTPRSAHAVWAPAADRPDPVTLLEEQAVNRAPELVPIRYGRMAVSPFTFYRGAALIMASDLADSPTSGITVQLCGDAHLSNFGVFGTPERTLTFDINDFDETLPGPWEWDLKRLAASFEVAGQHRGFSDAERRDSVLSLAKAYRERMRTAAHSPVLASWYNRISADDALNWLKHEEEENRAGKRQVKRTTAVLTKALSRDSLSAFTKLVGVVDGELRILAVPPLIVPIDDLAPAGRTREAEVEQMRQVIAEYQSTLTQQNHPLHEFEYLHMARKVVGVGSVGTRAWILLLRGRDDKDPLLLQAKEAQESVLERFLPASEYAHHGERVVRGQRMMQAASDIFLGWQRVQGFDGEQRDFYVRQLHDWKGSADVENMDATGAVLYAHLCGETLARAHARTGDRVAIAAYLGSSDVFDHALADFAAAYAQQNERDFAAFEHAVESGRLHAVSGL
ncbi:DUF2252 domain-containing protein [Microterricola viridarii]|uniref:DUF2252 domain-containing protein n=1 Tax=Microterricola viridarii TaxID=412690 RepID=A0A0X8E4B9_9MICO|nr:DUF2252 domain-containing protein [Microterricola viridarii]AMB59467.1 hypothetical protein AWU67_12030 [Microterricola viridarii]